MDLKKYPKAKEALNKHVDALLLKMLADSGLPQDVAAFTVEDDVRDSYLSALLTGGSRAFYDIFDLEGLYLMIDRTPDMWVFYINGGETNGNYTSRVEAEKAGIEECLKLWEKKL